MRVIFRADAGIEQGSGHVMRCLTLAEEFTRRGDDIAFAGAIDSVPWLADYLATGGFPIVGVEADDVPLGTILGLQPDWVVVDSYRIDSTAINELAKRVSVLAIVDGDARGIDAQLYLDQNLGAVGVLGREDDSLVGASYALIRDAVLSARRDQPWRMSGVPRLTAFMGGTDPGGIIVGLAEQLARSEERLDVTVVAPSASHSAVVDLLPRATVLAPTPELPVILAHSDAIVSAAGTSAWDVCTLGVPALLVGVVDNQSAGLEQVVGQGLALGIDLTRGGSLESVTGEIARIVRDNDLRESLSRSSTAAFDGGGKRRVAGEMASRLGR